MARYLYSELASAVSARRTLARLLSSNGGPEINAHHQEWFARHEDRIESLVREHVPSGSGFDSGTTLDLESSHADKLVFQTRFHHMNDGGYYDGWTEHTIVVTPSFIGGFSLRVSGRNRNDIKEYIGDTFYAALMTEVKQ